MTVRRPRFGPTAAATIPVRSYMPQDVRETQRQDMRRQGWGHQHLLQVRHPHTYQCLKHCLNVPGENLLARQVSIPAHVMALTTHPLPYLSPCSLQLQVVYTQPDGVPIPLHPCGWGSVATMALEVQVKAKVLPAPMGRPLLLRPSPRRIA
jgi:hypothetical protein